MISPDVLTTGEYATTDGPNSTELWLAKVALAKKKQERNERKLASLYRTTDTNIDIVNRLVAKGSGFSRLILMSSDLDQVHELPKIGSFNAGMLDLVYDSFGVDRKTARVEESNKNGVYQRKTYLSQPEPSSIEFLETYIEDIDGWSSFRVFAMAPSDTL